MKILALGDPHGDLDLIKKINLKGLDLIVLTGDLGSASLMRKRHFENVERQKEGLPKKEYSPLQKKQAFMEAYTSTIKLVKYLAKFAPVYTIFGNVESSNAETRKQSKEIGLPLPFLTDDLNAIDNVKVINNKVVNFQGVRIGGLEYFVDTNWVEEFKPSDYEKKYALAKKATEKAKATLARFEKLDVLVCHQPPFGYLDQVNFQGAPAHWQGKHAGSKTILAYIKQKKPRYVVCGHIHEGAGKTIIGKSNVYNLGVGKFQIFEF